MDTVIKVLASGFGLGYLPYAPGTFGTLAGVLIFLPLTLFSPVYYAAFTAAFFLLASLVSEKAETIYKTKDASVIVIDEITGFLVTMAFIKPSLNTVILGFVYFRFFDIIKLWPVKTFDNMSGGFAVVMDDVVAGIYANMLLRLTINFLPVS